MSSIRLYLIIVLLSTICLVNFVAALHGYRSSMAEADRLLDRQLSDSANLLARLDIALREVANEGSSPGQHGEVQHPQLVHPQTLMFQIWQGGHLLARSDNAPDGPILPLESGFHAHNHKGLRWRMLVVNASIDSGADAGVGETSAGNSLTSSLGGLGGGIDANDHNSNKPDRWVIVGQSADAYRTLVEGVIFESIWPIIWVLPVLGVLIWLIVGLGLRPLRQLARLLEERKADDLMPLVETGYPGELTTLVASTNSLLARLSEAFEREKRFASDAAHELRTPLAVLKVNLHNIAAEVDMDNASLQELEASVDRMSHSIEQILALYRLTPDKFNSTLSRADISALARAVIAELYPRCREKNQQITLEAEPLAIECDAFAITTLLRNLIDNASKYSPAGGSIAVSISASSISGRPMSTRGQPQKNRLLITVEDSGPGIPASSRDQVFDRFYRVGGDQHGSGEVGCGLGLSIVDHIVHLHQGEIELDLSPNLGGLRVKVTLPCQQGAPVALPMALVNV